MPIYGFVFKYDGITKICRQDKEGGQFSVIHNLPNFVKDSQTSLTETLAELVEVEWVEGKETTLYRIVTRKVVEFKHGTVQQLVHKIGTIKLFKTALEISLNTPVNETPAQLPTTLSTVNSV